MSRLEFAFTASYHLTLKHQDSMEDLLQAMPPMLEALHMQAFDEILRCLNDNLQFCGTKSGKENAINLLNEL